MVLPVMRQSRHVLTKEVSIMAISNKGQQATNTCNGVHIQELSLAFVSSISFMLKGKTSSTLAMSKANY